MEVGELKFGRDRQVIGLLRPRNEAANEIGRNLAELRVERHVGREMRFAFCIGDDALACPRALPIRIAAEDEPHGNTRQRVILEIGELERHIERDRLRLRARDDARHQREERR